MSDNANASTVALAVTQLDLSVVIPAYNEERRIGPTIERVDAFLAGSGLRYEIVVVDDGSSDGTVALVEGMRPSRPALRCIASKPNRGKGSAVRIGMLGARGQIRLMCDADCSMPPEEMPKLINEIVLGNASIAIGSRYADGAVVATRQPFYRRLWSRLCNKAVQRFLVPGIRDTQCGFKAFTAQAANDLFRRAKINGWAFDLEVLALARRRGYDIAEIAVSWTDDARSRVNPLKDMWKVIREAVAIRKNLDRGVYGELGPAASMA
jgi:dolichyl-phosphate beta-glucosyltransferase